MTRLLSVAMGMGVLFAACFPGTSIAQQWRQSADGVSVAASTGKPATLIRGPSRAGAPRNFSPVDSPAQDRRDVPGQTRTRDMSQYSAENQSSRQVASDGPYGGSFPQTPNRLMPNSVPEERAGGQSVAQQRTEMAAARGTHSTGGRRMETLLQPQESLPTGGSVSPGSGKYQNLEIQVSHSEHVYKLFGVLPGGSKDLLKECRVGLGSEREFPTPVGVYYVTYIYDDNPWWIPPPNRAWAAGQSPSQRVYGGTMAPLLKKRLVNSKKKTPDFDDYISEEVKLEDHGYRFHGTNAPRSIGHNQSHGCVRMLPPDAKEAANLIKEHVGVTEERKDENGKFVILRAPVRLNLIK